MGRNSAQMKRSHEEDAETKKKRLLMEAQSMLESDGGHKKHKKEKKEKKDKKEKKKDKKKQDSDSDSDKSSSEPEEAPPGGINSADYLSKNAEFRIWLSEAKGKFFDDQTTDVNKKLFKKFVKAWNSKKLAEKFYNGVQNSGQDMTAGRTRHVWGFAKKMDSSTKMQLETARDRVESQTETGREYGGRSKESNVFGTTGLAKNPAELQEEKRLQRKSELKAFRKNEKETMNELVPKADSGSREAQLDKKREIGAKMHGAAKAAEESRDGLGMDDSTMYGGGNDDFKRAVARRDAWRGRKQDERDHRGDQARQKETARMQDFMSSLGIKPGEKITMRERDD